MPPGLDDSAAACFPKASACLQRRALQMQIQMHASNHHLHTQVPGHCEGRLSLGHCPPEAFCDPPEESCDPPEGFGDPPGLCGPPEPLQLPAGEWAVLQPRSWSGHRPSGEAPKQPLDWCQGLAPCRSGGAPLAPPIPPPQSACGSSWSRHRTCGGLGERTRTTAG